VGAKRANVRLLAATCSLVFVLGGHPALADVTPDEIGVVLELPQGPRDRWVWVSDRVLRHNLLFDGDTGRALGALDVATSLSGRIPLSSKALEELYVVESVYSRGHRGKRQDFVTIYDAKTLGVKGEIEIPPRAAETGGGVALVAILDDGGLLLVLNESPASVSVVDLAGRRFAGTVDAAGCACVYPTGKRSFGMLCGDGTAVHVFLDEQGHQASMHRSEPFFDVVNDPLTEKGVRRASRWLFASFEGYLHDIDFSASVPKVAERWSLFTSKERVAGWRVGGVQHLALHQPSGRLYSIVHRGGSGSHKDPGREVWVYDLDSKTHVQTIVMPNLVPAFARPLLQLERSSFWYRALTFVLSWFPGPGVHSVVVTQDREPLLFVRHSDIGALGVVDATSGETLREIEEIGISGANLGIF
jgi:amicyanin-dependent methylamine dehydrogenase large subunit